MEVKPWNSTPSVSPRPAPPRPGIVLRPKTVHPQQNTFCTQVCKPSQPSHSFVLFLAGGTRQVENFEAELGQGAVTQCGAVASGLNGP